MDNNYTITFFLKADSAEQAKSIALKMLEFIETEKIDMLIGKVEDHSFDDDNDDAVWLKVNNFYHKKGED